jgi:hypothetical protein
VAKQIGVRGARSSDFKERERKRKRKREREREIERERELKKETATSIGYEPSVNKNF